MTEQKTAHDFSAEHFKTARASFDTVSACLSGLFREDATFLSVLVKHVIGAGVKDGCISEKEIANFVGRFGCVASSSTSSTSSSSLSAASLSVERALQRAKANLFVKNEATHELTLVPWFHGVLERKEAEEMLQKTKKDGAFLLRYSDKFPTKLTFSYARFPKDKFECKNVVAHNLSTGFQFEGLKDVHPTLSSLLISRHLTYPVSSSIYHSLYSASSSSSSSSSSSLSSSALSNSSTPLPVANNYGVASDLLSVSPASSSSSSSSSSIATATVTTNNNNYGTSKDLLSSLVTIISDTPSASAPTTATSNNYGNADTLLSVASASPSSSASDAQQTKPKNNYGDSNDLLSSLMTPLTISQPPSSSPPPSSSSSASAASSSSRYSDFNNDLLLLSSHTTTAASTQSTSTPSNYTNPSSLI
eukprot:TRINITY_DN284_c0_g1_i1.p1 TRINITY_DN284_c0_g1~~TRINITY_DN284_c0_g1_i1.p1  ORF type:complete len:426 (-),score=167.24 TRINITY_DN284_c0_g1_i1:192-1448(-)